jgi:hypothetical protein
LIGRFSARINVAGRGAGRLHGCGRRRQPCQPGSGDTSAKQQEMSARQSHWGCELGFSDDRVVHVAFSFSCGEHLFHGMMLQRKSLLVMK